MTGPAIFSRIGAVIANQPFFWLIFSALIVLIGVAANEALERKPLRAGIAWALSAQCFLLLCGDWL